MPSIKEKLAALEARHLELVKTPFKSDQELIELEQLEHEINKLKKTLQGQASDLDQDYIKEKTEKTKPPAEKNNDKPKSNKEMSGLEPDAYLRYSLLRKKERIINTKLKAFRLEQEIEKKEQKLRELEKEQQYVTKKPDKDGIIQLDQDKYERKMQELQEKLSKAQGWKEKNAIKAQINHLQMAKIHTKINNSAIKISKGAAKFSKFMDDIGKTFGEFSKFSGYKEKTRKNDDFGFNENVFKY